MEETIGKVKLNFDGYTGEDLYSDGAVEDELLEVVRNYPEAAFPKIIEEKKSWPFLYHLSVQRQNIVEWLPLEEKKVLEVGSGCGAITGMLARKAKVVTGVDLSAKRSRINANRNSDCENLTLYVGNFKDIEPTLDRDYDYILLIGVFEYAISYMGTKNPYEDFLRILKEHLRDDGRMVIAIENKYGLKYFAGCKEDHLGTYFGGIENYADGGNVRTFGRNRLESFLRGAGFSQFQFYYPYPDYKFMTTLYSDQKLPAKGELSNNLRNFDRERMLLFDEKNAFDGILDEGLFTVFSNSYLVVTGDELCVEYVRYSSDRDPAFCIKTEITRDRTGGLTVAKKPLSGEAYAHVEKMKDSFEQLSKLYRDSKLDINVCRLRHYNGMPSAEFEFIKGRTLTELLDECLERGDIEGFHSLFREYLERIGYGREIPLENHDLNFSNFILQNGRWVLIDYEWMFERPMDLKELAFRAVCGYIYESAEREKMDFSRVFDEIGINDEEAEEYREKERRFQQYVMGGRIAMPEFREMLGQSLHVPQKWIERYADEEKTGWRRVQIYEDTGAGFCEEQAYFAKDAFRGEDRIELNLLVSGDVRVLRIDPAFSGCAVKIDEMTFNGVRIPLEKKKVLQANGKVSKPQRGETYRPCIVFDTEDPNILIRLEGLERAGENILTASIQVVRLPAELSRDMVRSFKKRV